MKHRLTFCLALLLALSQLALAQPDLSAKFEIGDTAPAFEGIDQHEKTVNSTELLKNGPVLVIFYRGAWCGYCKKHLNDLQDSLQLVLDKGASVVVVTPSGPESIDKMVSKTGATYSIVQDKDYKIMDAFGVKFDVISENVPKFFGYTLKATREASGNEDDVLPVPATFVIDKEGQFSFIHFDPVYKYRSTVTEILDHL